MKALPDPGLLPFLKPAPAAPARHPTGDRPPGHGARLLGRLRWPVERSLAWLHQFRRLLVRFERRADIHEALLTIGCCLICFRKLQGSF